MLASALLLGLALQSATADERPTADDLELALFEPQIRAAANSRQHSDLIKLVDLPLRVNTGGPTARTRYYHTVKSIERDFPRIFTAEIIRALQAGKYEISGFGKGMIGVGDVWFGRPCHAKVCYPEGPGHFRIMVINQSD